MISALFLESSYAYPAKSFIQTGNMAVMNSDETTSDTITRPMDKIADNSQITKSISTNAQGADSKTYRIKPANTSSKAYDHDQINKLNINTMKWESELKSIELLKSGSHNSISNPKFR